jgi:hypothetical protein
MRKRRAATVIRRETRRSNGQAAGYARSGIESCNVRVVSEISPQPRPDEDARM